MFETKLTMITISKRTANTTSTYIYVNIEFNLSAGTISIYILIEMRAQIVK